MARGRTVSVLVERHDADGAKRQPDELVVEEPMEIRLDGHLVTTTMRTPGHDYELAVGFCFSDGLLAGAPVRQVRYCATGTATETVVQRGHRRDGRPGARADASADDHHLLVRLVRDGPRDAARTVSSRWSA